MCVCVCEYGECTTLTVGFNPAPAGPTKLWAACETASQVCAIPCCESVFYSGLAYFGKPLPPPLHP